MEESQAIDFLSSLIPFTAIVFVIAVGVILLSQQFRKNLYKQQLAKEELANEHQRALLQTSIQVQEQERKRIAEDLHDELGAVLSISRMQLLQLERQLTFENQEQESRVKQLRENIEGALSSTRRISHELMPAQLSHAGLPATLRSLAEKMSSATGVEVSIEALMDIDRMPWNVELGLYRIFSELLNNTLKHAQASQVCIAFEENTTVWKLNYTDNGRGLPDDMSHAGLGLKGLEGRAKALEGKLEYGTRSDQGFYAMLEVPKARWLQQVLALLVVVGTSSF